MDNQALSKCWRDKKSHIHQGGALTIEHEQVIPAQRDAGQATAVNLATMHGPAASMQKSPKYLVVTDSIPYQWLWQCGCSWNWYHVCQVHKLLICTTCWWAMLVVKWGNDLLTAIFECRRYLNCCSHPPSSETPKSYWQDYEPPEQFLEGFFFWSHMYLSGVSTLQIWTSLSWLLSSYDFFSCFEGFTSKSPGETPMTLSQMWRTDTKKTVTFAANVT